MTSAPVVPQVPAGFAPLPADMDSWITTPFTSVTDGALFRGQLQGGQSLGAATDTLVKLDTVLEDPLGGWSATATGSQPAYSWLCPAGWSGWYEISLTAWTRSQGSSPTQVGGEIWVSGTLYQFASLGWGVNGNAGGSCGAVQVPLAGGSDYVQMYIYSTNAVSTSTGAGEGPAMEIAWVSS